MAAFAPTVEELLRMLPGGEACDAATAEETEAAERVYRDDISTWFRPFPAFSVLSTVRGLRSYRPRKTDVMVATFPKSGTTWASYIAHLLRDGGGKSDALWAKGEISCVVPELVQSYDYGLDVNAEQVGSPRVFKSHLTPSRVRLEHGGELKTVVVLREPKDVAASMYNFFKPKAAENLPWLADMSLDAFVASTYWTEHAWLFCGALTQYHREAWAARDDPRTLLLFFEDMEEDLEGSVRRIAHFMDVADDDGELVRTVARKASHAEMRKHKTLFDEHFVHQMQTHLGRHGSAPLTPSDKVSENGRSGGGRASMRSEAAAGVDAWWRAGVGCNVGVPKGGLESYAAMRAFRAAELAPSP